MENSVFNEFLFYVIEQNLSEDLIREFKDKLDWKMISSKQKLSEDFIRKFQDKVDWASISSEQELSEDFFREFQDKMYWQKIYQKISLESLKIGVYNRRYCKK